MRRCVRMTSNGSSGSGHSSGGGSSGGMARSLRMVDVEEGGRERESAAAPARESEQALFWAAISGCLALHGDKREGDVRSDDDITTRGTSFRDSSSASPRSPAHSVDSESTCWPTGLRRPLPPDAPIDLLTRLRAYREGGLPGSPSPAAPPTTGADSFCIKLAHVLASDKRLGTQPIALRALQRAGVVDPLATVSNALTSSIGHNSLPPAIAASLNDPALSPHLASHLTASLEQDRLAQRPPPIAFSAAHLGRSHPGRDEAPSPTYSMEGLTVPPPSQRDEAPTNSTAPAAAADALVELLAAAQQSTPQPPAATIANSPASKMVGAAAGGAAGFMDRLPPAAAYSSSLPALLAMVAQSELSMSTNALTNGGMATGLRNGGLPAGLGSYTRVPPMQMPLSAIPRVAPTPKSHG